MYVGKRLNMSFILTMSGYAQLHSKAVTLVSSSKAGYRRRLLTHMLQLTQRIRVGLRRPAIVVAANKSVHNEIQNIRHDRSPKEKQH